MIPTCIRICNKKSKKGNLKLEPNKNSKHDHDIPRQPSQEVINLPRIAPPSNGGFVRCWASLAGCNLPKDGGQVAEFCPRNCWSLGCLHSTAQFAMSTKDSRIKMSTMWTYITQSMWSTFAERSEPELVKPSPPSFTR